MVIVTALVLGVHHDVEIELEKLVNHVTMAPIMVVFNIAIVLVVVPLHDVAMEL